MLADLAHERGLAIGLKNDLGQADELAGLFDFSVVEQCAEFDECHALQPFLDRGKPVFHAEYHLERDQFARWRDGSDCRPSARNSSWTPGARPVEATSAVSKLFAITGEIRHDLWGPTAIAGVECLQ